MACLLGLIYTALAALAVWVVLGVGDALAGRRCLPRVVQRPACPPRVPHWARTGQLSDSLMTPASSPAAARHARKATQ